MEMERRTLFKVGAVMGIGAMVKALGLESVIAKEGGETFEVTKTDSEWRAILSTEQYRVLRQEATESPFRNQYHDQKTQGTYHCVGCDLPLFSSQAKYDSETGWPSFWEPISVEAVGTKTDWRLIIPRTEVHCARCGLDTGLTPVTPLCSVLRHAELSQGHVRFDDPFFY